MGKRKSSARKPPKKVKTKLDTTFKCLFCNAPSSVTVKIDTVSKTGVLSCKSCPVSFETAVNALSQAIDVYAEWVDELPKIIELQQNRNSGRAGRLEEALGRDSDDEEDAGESTAMAGRGRVIDDDEDDDF